MRSPRRIAGLALLLISISAPCAHATNVSTVAGDGTAGSITSTWNWSSSLQVGFGAPQAVAIDHTPAADGLDYYVTDATGCRIFKVDGGIGPNGATGPISILLGLMQSCRSADDRFFNHEYNGAQFPPTGNEPYLKNPAQLASLADGRLLWSETNQGRVNALSTDNYIDTVVGSGTCGTPPATATAALSAPLCKITGLAPHPTSGSTFLISDGQTGRVYQMDGTNVTPVASGLTKPEGVTYIGTAGIFLVVDHDAGKVWKFSTADNTVSTVVASGLSQPAYIAPAYDGGFYVTEEGTCDVVHVADLSGSGATLVVAGSTCGGPSGDGGQATNAMFPHPLGIASYASGLLIADPVANTIRRVERTTITTAPGPYTNHQPFPINVETLDVGGTTACTLEGVVASMQAFSDCAAPNFGSSWPDDHYTLYAQTNDNNGDPQGPEAGWTLDTELPNAPALTTPADGAKDLPPRPSFSWTAVTDPIRVLYGTTSGIGRYEVLVDDTKVAQTTRVDDNDPATAAQADVGLPEGNHTWKVRAYDRAGNYADSPTRAFSTSSPPTAVLTIGPNRALVGSTLTFDGSASSDPDGPLALYEWDFTSDGTFDASGPDPKVTHSFTTPGDFTATLRVTDGVGRTVTASATYTITNSTIPPGQTGVTINNGAQYTNKPDVKVFIKAPAGTTQVLLSNDGGFLAPTSFAPAPEVDWHLDSSGPERLPKTVYVRFLNGTITLVTLTDDIILDERPPVVSQAALAPASPGAASAAKLRTWKLNVKATDSNSGVAGVQVTANKRKPGSLLTYKRKLTVKLATKPKFLRAKDKAGNFSGWKKIR